MRSYALAPEPAPPPGGGTRVLVDSRETPSKRQAAEAQVTGTMGVSGFGGWSPIFPQIKKIKPRIHSTFEHGEVSKVEVMPKKNGRG